MHVPMDNPEVKTFHKILWCGAKTLEEGRSLGSTRQQRKNIPLTPKCEGMNKIWTQGYEDFFQLPATRQPSEKP